MSPWFFKLVSRLLPMTLFAATFGLAAAAPAEELSTELDFTRLAALRSVTHVAVSPEGSQIAYTLRVQRKPGKDDDGAPWVELHLVSTSGGDARPYVHGEVKVSEVRFSPDGSFLTYLAKRGDDKKAGIWAIPVSGGESTKLLTHAESILDYRISPDGGRVAFLALEPEDKRREKARKKGYKQEIFEEDWRPRKVWVAPMPPLVPAVEDPLTPGKDEQDDEQDDEPKSLEIVGSVFGLEWLADGRRLVLAVAPTPLIDDRYMARRLHVVDATSGERLARIENSGKLGEYSVSPDGSQVALITAADPNDPSAGRLMLAPSSGGAPRDLLPDLEGHVRDLAWQDAEILMFVADRGTGTVFGEVNVRTGEAKTHLESDPEIGSPILRELSLSRNGSRIAFVGESPSHPGEAFTLSYSQPLPQRRTHSNPWLEALDLAPQEVVRWRSRDGMQLEGILIRPLRPESRSPAPLLLMVHGGPESHDRNGWVTAYSRPGQIAAARGYAVLYPNYRGSTGRGVEFSKLGQGDAAGKEFDDLVDAVDHLVEVGIADRNRVGITGGSYGGYATAWCSTRFSDRFRAGVMFVGISNKLSKGLTTEIPVEDKMVHTRFDAWTRWDFSLERSPIFHAESSRTALLIAGGTDDSRVHPSQSLQLYRALKLIGKTPVRYVRYPGEGHGNSKAAARDDYGRRLMRWMDHFVMEKNRDLPPWDLKLGHEEQKDGDDDDDTED